jgi:hypothetical protein
MVGGWTAPWLRTATSARSIAWLTLVFSSMSCVDGMGSSDGTGSTSDSYVPWTYVAEKASTRSSVPATIASEATPWSPVWHSLQVASAVRPTDGFATSDAPDLPEERAMELALAPETACEIEARIETLEGEPTMLGIVVGYDAPDRYFAILIDEQGRIDALGRDGESSSVHELGALDDPSVPEGWRMRATHAPDGTTLVRLADVELSVASERTPRLGLLRPAGLGAERYVSGPFFEIRSSARSPGASRSPASDEAATGE